jgi:hypothetical protein
VSLLPQHLTPVVPCFLLRLQSVARPFVSLVLASPLRPFADRYGSPAVNHCVGPAAVEPLDGDEVRLERAREWRPACTERGRAACGVDSPAADGSGAQPAARLHRQLHSPPRARLRGAGEPLHAWVVLPLQGGAAQLCAQRDFAGSHLRRRLRGAPGIPANWDLWVHLFRAELHTLTTPEPRVHRVVQAGGMTISLRESRR